MASMNLAVGHHVRAQLNKAMKFEQTVKPDPQEEKRLTHYGDFPDHYNLTGDEEIFVWKFRYWLLE